LYDTFSYMILLAAALITRHSLLFLDPTPFLRADDSCPQT